ncbi:hypothetical protein PR048_023416 [Dryococelus australis]|uniref:DUF7869 domain-containing protein n=1 Tax=Dryococelus australis TaxID=614101 RepID=A0ABQ9GU18_9NEOP|nr:hypothetical protein PR048_023416 [Dryococelus australis]
MSVNQVKQRRPRKDVNHAKFHENAYNYKVRVSDDKKIIGVPFVLKHLFLFMVSQHKEYKPYRNRGESKKLYLPPELNVNKMHHMYKDKGLLVESYQYYRNIFNFHFNIKYGYPRSDICSAYDKFLAEIRETKFTRLKEEHSTPEKELQKPGVEHKHITKVLKNLSTPNISLNDVYYKRQLSLFTFNIHLKQEAKRIEIFCDNCGGQNKNYTVVRYLHYVVHNTRRQDSIKVTFLIRGHLYFECDRNMALIKLTSPAELPEHWLNHFSVARMKPSVFHVIEVDQMLLRSWTNFLLAEYKKKCPFTARPVKEVLFQHVLGSLVHHRSTYNGAWESPSLKEPLRHSHPQDSKDATGQNGEFRLPDYLYDGMLASFFTL